MMSGRRLADTQQTMNRTGATIAVMLVLLLSFAIYALIYVSVPAENQNALLVVIGALTTSVITIVNYFYGSSSGARQKDQTISQQANTAAAIQAVTNPITTTTTTTAGVSSPTVSPVVATVSTPSVEVPLHAGEAATVKADNTPT